MKGKTLTENNSTTPDFDLSSLSENEFAAYVDKLRGMQEALKSHAEVEKVRLETEYSEIVTSLASFVVAHGEPTTTALWSGFKGKSQHVSLNGVTYAVNVSLTNVKRQGELKAAAAEKKATA